MLVHRHASPHRRHLIGPCQTGCTHRLGIGRETNRGRGNHDPQHPGRRPSVPFILPGQLVQMLGRGEHVGQISDRTALLIEGPHALERMLGGPFAYRTGLAP